MFLESDPIENIERELRQVIHDVLSNKFGQNWVNLNEVNLGERWLKGIEAKVKSDKSAQGNQTIYDLPLSYSEFSDLKKLISKHEELFKVVFDKWVKTLEYLDTVEGLRNTIKHHRDISSTQKHLLIGIAGEIVDSINFWRIGTKAHVRQIVLTFSDYISTDGKTEENILSESKQKIVDLKNQINKSLIRSGFKGSEIEIQVSDFHTDIKALNLKIEINTTNQPKATSGIDGVNCKQIVTNLFYDMDCKIELDRVVSDIGKQYWVIEYRLEDDINIGALRDWSNQQAGLSPGSSSAMNGTPTSIEYPFLGGRLRVGASKYQDNKNSIKGKLYLIQNGINKIWFPHRVITANHILGFILGNISPRAILHLHEQASGN